MLANVCTMQVQPSQLLAQLPLFPSQLMLVQLQLLSARVDVSAQATVLHSKYKVMESVDSCNKCQFITVYLKRV